MMTLMAIWPVMVIVIMVVFGLGIATFFINLKGNNMDNRNVGTAKDFFMQLGAIVTFYASAIALITLLFDVINFAYPKVAEYGYYGVPSISLQVATLIVAFPLFLLISWFLQKAYIVEPELKNALVRRWLSYITLFIAGGVVAGDLITVIYMYLDGQELTTGFLLKVLTLLIVAGGIFLYYLREIRNVISAGERNIWRIVALIIVLGSIIIGFSVVGSPREQRERRYDNQRTSDLQGLQWQIVNYWQQKQVLPANLEALRDPISGFVVPVDPKTKGSYEYEPGQDKAGELFFRLCATFDTEFKGTNAPWPMKSVMSSAAFDYRGVPVNENWEHGKGKTCFDRTIDPDLYPPIKR